MALIKVSLLWIGPLSESMILATRHQQAGHISRIALAAVTAEVTRQLDGGSVMVFISTNGSAQSLGPTDRWAVITIVKPSNMILRITTG